MALWFETNPKNVNKEMEKVHWTGSQGPGSGSAPANKSLGETEAQFTHLSPGMEFVIALAPTTECCQKLSFTI